MQPQLSEEQYKWLWLEQRYEPQWKPEVRERVRKTLDHSGAELANWLLGKSALADVTVSAVRQLELVLATHTERNLLREITRRVRTNVPDFPLARIAIAIKRPANPINPDVYTSKQLHASEVLRRALTQGYKLKLRELAELEVSERIGLLLLSAAYSGGLLDANQLEALTRLAANDIKWLAGTPEIRLSLSIDGDETAEFRQWMPDPATLALLVRYLEDLKAEVEARRLMRSRLVKYVNAFLKRVGIPEQNRPRNLSEMLLWVRMQMQLCIPQLLIGFGCRSYVSHSLRPTNWGEMFSCHEQVDPEGAYAEVARGPEPEQEEISFWLAALCAEIRKGQMTPPSAYQDDCSPVQYLVRSWAGYMLKTTHLHSKNRSKSLKPNTIATYVRVVGAVLDSFLGDESVFEVGSSTLEVVYESAVEAQTNDKKRRTLVSAIQKFHGYLQQVHKLPPISSYSILAGSRSVVRVDARVLNEEQYQEVLKDLTWCGLEIRTPRLVQAAKLLFVLGYRLGLRRSEALMLKLSDVHIPELDAEDAARVQRRHINMSRIPDNGTWIDLAVDLMIRPSNERGLKTLNSVRRLPLTILLEPNEIVLLRDWWKQRQEEEAEKPTSEFLFCIPQLRTRWISEDSLIPAIHTCMRRVTGCPEMRFHHLRHSCATWLTLKLMGIVTGSNADLLLGELELTRTWLSDTSRLKLAFFSESAGPTRKVMHIVSAVMGHGRPKTTLLHYVHSMPWIMAQSWQWGADVWLFNAHNLATMAGVSEPRRQVHRKLEPLKADWAIQRINRIESLLSYADYIEKAGLKADLEDFEFSAPDIAFMLERARYIRDLAKHRFTTSLHTEEQSLTPERPRSGSRFDLTDYAQRLYGLLEGAEAMRVIRVIDFFIEHCWETETTLRFRRGVDEDMAKDYLWLLESIGVKRCDVELIVYAAKAPSKTKSQWRREIGWPRAAFQQRAPENPGVDNQHLGIRPILRGEDGRELYHYGSALRYLLVLASIDWHFRV